jgi:hypothetical protein
VKRHESKRRRLALISQIEAAFDGMSREDGTTLHEAIAIDDYERFEDQLAARRHDIESRWQDVPDRHIRARCSALSFLCPKGFRYYIPAFMTFGLGHFGNDPTGILSSCEFHLTHESGKSLRKSEPESIAAKYGFNGLQCRAIATFLRFGIEYHETTADQASVQAVEKWERFVATLGPGNEIVQSSTDE